MKNNKLLLAAGLMAGSVITCLPVTGFAFETLTFSGGICSVFDPTKAGQVQTHHSGAVNTSATSSVVVTCPLTRDFTSDLNGASIIVKAFRDAAATTPLSCTFVSRDFNGDALASSSNQVNGVGVVTMTLSVTKSGINGYYAVACSLPQKSVLRGITLNE